MCRKSINSISRMTDLLLLEKSYFKTATIYEWRFKININIIRRQRIIVENYKQSKTTNN